MFGQMIVAYSKKQETPLYDLLVERPEIVKEVRKVMRELKKEETEYICDYVMYRDWRDQNIAASLRERRLRLTELLQRVKEALNG